jgi:hypothetical protein
MICGGGNAGIKFMFGFKLLIILIIYGSRCNRDAPDKVMR